MTRSLEKDSLTHGLGIGLGKGIFSMESENHSTTFPLSDFPSLHVSLNRSSSDSSIQFEDNQPSVGPHLSGIPEAVFNFTNSIVGAGIIGKGFPFISISPWVCVCVCVWVYVREREGEN